MFTSVTTAGTSNSYNSPGPFGMAQHIDPSQVFHNEHPGRSPGVQMGHENMFTFGGDSDGEEDEGAAFADRTLMMQHDFTQSPMDDPNMDMGPGGQMQWDTSLSGQFNTQAARYPGGPPRKQVTIGGTTTEVVDWEGSGGSLGRGHASTQSVSDNRRGGNDRRPKIPRTASTPNAALMGSTTNGAFEIGLSDPQFLQVTVPICLVSHPSLPAGHPPQADPSMVLRQISQQPCRAKNGVPTNLHKLFYPNYARSGGGNPEGHPLCNACGPLPEATWRCSTSFSQDRCYKEAKIVDLELPYR